MELSNYSKIFKALSNEQRLKIFMMIYKNCCSPEGSVIGSEFRLKDERMEISHQELDDNVSLIRLKGRLDARTSLEVKDTLQELLKDQGQRKIIVDLEEVPFIDSSGLAALVSGLRLARENKGDIVLSGAQSQAQIVFRLTMLDRIFAIHPTVEEARQSLL